MDELDNLIVELSQHTAALPVAPAPVSIKAMSMSIAPSAVSPNRSAMVTPGPPTPAPVPPPPNTPMIPTTPSTPGGSNYGLGGNGGGFGRGGAGLSPRQDMKSGTFGSRGSLNFSELDNLMADLVGHGEPGENGTSGRSAAAEGGMGNGGASPVAISPFPSHAPMPGQARGRDRDAVGGRGGGGGRLSAEAGLPDGYGMAMGSPSSPVGSYPPSDPLYGITERLEDTRIGGMGGPALSVVTPAIPGASRSPGAYPQQQQQQQRQGYPEGAGDQQSPSPQFPHPPPQQYAQRRRTEDSTAGSPGHQQSLSPQLPPPPPQQYVQRRRTEESTVGSPGNQQSMSPQLPPPPPQQYMQRRHTEDSTAGSPGYQQSFSPQLPPPPPQLYAQRRRTEDSTAGSPGHQQSYSPQFPPNPNPKPQQYTQRRHTEDSTAGSPGYQQSLSPQFPPNPNPKPQQFAQRRRTEDSTAALPGHEQYMSPQLPPPPPQQYAQRRRTEDSTGTLPGYQPSLSPQSLPQPPQHTQRRRTEDSTASSPNAAPGAPPMKKSLISPVSNRVPEDSFKQFQSPAAPAGRHEEFGTQIYGPGVDGGGSGGSPRRESAATFAGPPQNIQHVRTPSLPGDPPSPLPLSSPRNSLQPSPLSTRESLPPPPAQSPLNRGGPLPPHGRPPQLRAGGPPETLRIPPSGAPPTGPASPLSPIPPPLSPAPSESGPGFGGPGTAIDALNQLLQEQETLTKRRNTGLRGRLPSTPSPNGGAPPPSAAGGGPPRGDDAAAALYSPGPGGGVGNGGPSSPAAAPPLPTPPPAASQFPAPRATRTSMGGVSSRGNDVCPGCNEPVVGPTFTALNRVWHPDCFVCGHCKKKLGSLTFFEHEGFPYCAEDYRELFSPRCGYCNGVITDQCVTALGKVWHTDHFFCCQCGRQFENGVFHEHDGKAYCEEDYLNMFAPKCANCKKAVTDENIQALGKNWHARCFHCKECKKPFTSGSFFDYEGEPYCEEHFHLKQGSLCGRCQKPIVGRCVTAIGKRFHPEHFLCQYCARQLSTVACKQYEGKPYCMGCYVKLFG